MNYVMMSHGGELLARFRGLIKAHDQYKLLSETKFKGLQQQLSYINSLNSKISNLKEQIGTLNERVVTSKTTLVKARKKSKDRKKKSKSLSKALDQFTAKATRVASDSNYATG
ncbi:hypothetical protein Tco_1071995 [Tanacetum coccineum]